MRMRIGAVRSMLRLSICRSVELYTVPVRTTAEGSISELVVQPLSIASVTAEETTVSQFALRIPKMPTAKVPFNGFRIPIYARHTDANPKNTCEPKMRINWQRLRSPTSSMR